MILGLDLGLPMAGFRSKREETRPETQKDPLFQAETPESWTPDTSPEPLPGFGTCADGSSAAGRGVSGSGGEGTWTFVA